MVKRWFAAGLVLVMVASVVVGCGIPPALAERDAAKTRIASLESELADANTRLASLQRDLDAARRALTEVERTTQTSPAQSELSSFANTMTVDTFDGTWRGTVYLPDDSGSFELSIAGYNASIIFSSGARPLTVERLGPNLLLYFMDQGGIWTETQVYTLASLTRDSVQILYTRQVHNEGGTTWSVQGIGTLKKQ